MRDVSLEVIRHVARYWSDRGYSPTVRELMRDIGCSWYELRVALARLERDGHIRNGHVARSLFVTESGLELLGGG